MNKVTSWSYSAYSKWKSCPAKYAYAKFDRIPERKHPAAERGITIHKLMEEYIKGTIKGMPDELVRYKAELEVMKKLKVTPEADWTIKEDGTPTHAKDWEGAWLRAKIDAHHYFPADKELIVVDGKTGRVRNYIDQETIYSWLGALAYPEAELISTELWFFDHDIAPTRHYFTRKEALKYGEQWRKKVKPMFADRKFKPTPSKDSCQWCPYRSDKKLITGQLGPCDKWKRN